MPNYRIVYNGSIQHDAFSRDKKASRTRTPKGDVKKKQESKTVEVSREYIQEVLGNSRNDQEEAAKYMAQRFLDGFKNVDEDLFDAWYAVGQYNKSKDRVPLTISARMK